MTKSSKREYRFVPLLFTVFFLMPMAAVAQKSNTQAAEDPSILHDVALKFVANTDGSDIGTDFRPRLPHREVALLITKLVKGC